MTDTNLEVDLKDTPQDYRLECLVQAVKVAVEARSTNAHEIVGMAQRFFAFVETGV